MVDVGVVIGRFQTAVLTAGHLAVLRAASHQAQLLILVGVSPKINVRNPLDFVARKHMLAQAFPQAIILPLPDIDADDETWASQVDSLIHMTFGPNANPTFYFGRDSFWPHYSPYGEHKKELQVNPETDISATNTREQITAGYVAHNTDYRKGVIAGVLSVLKQGEK